MGERSRCRGRLLLESLDAEHVKEEMYRDMSEQARKIEHEAIPQWAEGLYYNKGLFGEALIYHDEEALYFELRGKDEGVVRLSYEMIDTLKEVIEDEQTSEEVGSS
jgi:predicted GNAT family acetyltransferase